MEIESVRALKQQALETLVAPALDEAARVRAFSAPAASIHRNTGAVAGVALGVSGHGGPFDYRLAVRVQGGLLLNSGELYERLHKLAEGEAEFRYIGRAAKQQAPWHASRQRPLLIGASVGHFGVTAGSTGAFPTHRKSGKRVLLSNNHVLANENQGRPGDAVLQAGVLDGGRRAGDSIGTLLDFTPLKTAGANHFDAAVAALDDGVPVDPLTLTGAPAPALKGARQTTFEIGEPVFKLGRTTGLTRGRVSAIEVDDVVVDYEMGSLTFDRQTEIEGDGDQPFSQGGDSGALVLDAGGFAVGLLFAGTDQGGSNGRGLSYVSDLGPILAALDLSLDV